MSDLPEDLIRLQCALDEARANLDAYVNTVAAERRAQFPHDEQIVERQTWTTEQDAELDRLRGAYMAVARAKWAHPAMAAARAAGAGPKLDDELRQEARAEPATV